MDVEFFGISLKTIAAVVGAVLVSGVGGLEGFKLIRPVVSKALAKLRSSKPAAVELPLGSIVDVEPDPEIEAVEGLIHAAFYAKQNGKRAMSDAALSALRELLTPDEGGT